MEEILGKITAVAAALKTLKGDLEGVQIPSEQEASEAAGRIEEVRSQFCELESSLVKKQSAFLRILLMLARRNDRTNSPKYGDCLSVGKHTLIYYCHQWSLKVAGRCEYFFGTGERSPAFSEICRTLIEEVRAATGGLRSGELKRESETLAGLISDLQGALPK